MLDSQGRNINYLRLSVTDRCNFRCQYCMPADGIENKLSHADILSIENLIEISEIAVTQLGIQKIRITGGEPLVRKGVLELCQNLKRLPGLEELCLTTNGSLLTEMARPLRQAGVDRLNISLDSLSPERFHEITRGGSLSDVLHGIEAAETAGFRNLKIDTVLIGGINDHEINDLVALTKYHPWEVRFIELMPMGPCALWPRDRFISAETVLRCNPELQKSPDSGVASRYAFPNAPGFVGLIAPLNCSFCSACSRIRITADGMLKTCLHSREEVSLKGLHGSALKSALENGILTKPARHNLQTGSSDTHRNMNQIGG